MNWLATIAVALVLGSLAGVVLLLLFGCADCRDDDLI